VRKILFSLHLIYNGIVESSLNFRQLAKFQELYWRKYSGLSPIDEIPGDVLAKVQWTFAISESHIGENLIDEIPEPPIDKIENPNSLAVVIIWLFKNNLLPFNSMVDCKYLSTYVSV